MTTEYLEYLDSMDNGNPAKIKPSIRLITQNGKAVPEREFDRRKLMKLLYKCEFNVSTVENIARRIWYDYQYFLFLDGRLIFTKKT